jgi:hypothetical protein
MDLRFCILFRFVKDIKCSPLTNSPHAHSGVAVNDTLAMLTDPVPIFLVKWGIHLTQVTPRCSMAVYGGLPAKSGRIRSPLLERRGLPGVPGPATMAERLPLSSVRWAQELAGGRRSAAMFRLQLPKFGNGWDDFPGHPETADALVPGDVGNHQPEERRQCHRTPTGAGVGQLPDGLDLAA